MQEVQTEFACTHCEKVYAASQQLGGHISKAHPGVSSAYAQKIKRRDERKEERAFLAKAKEILAKSGYDAKKNRQLATKLKKELIQAELEKQSKSVCAQ